MKVFILSAEHFSVPGLILQAHATRESAVAEAIELTETMVGDSPYLEWEAVTDSTWESIVERLQDAHGAAHCYVEIAETDLRGLPADPVRDAAPDMLAALKECLPLFDMVTALDDHGSNALGQAENLIRAAIAKAEGAA